MSSSAAFAIAAILTAAFGGPVWAVIALGVFGAVWMAAEEL